MRQYPFKFMVAAAVVVAMAGRSGWEKRKGTR